MSDDRHFKSKKFTVVLTVIGIILVVVAGIIMLYRNGIFADIVSTPTVYLNAQPANGTNVMVFSAKANFNLTSAYFWWDCNTLASDDTKDELVRKCGIPHERIDNPSSGTIFQGNANTGARVTVYDTGAAYKVKLPSAKTNAKLVVFVTGTNIPSGMVQTRIYSTYSGAYNIPPISGTSFALRMVNELQGTRYTIIKADDPVGSLPARRYYLWYNCDFKNYSLDTPYSTVAASCGESNKTFGNIVNDRLVYTSNYAEAGPKTAFAIVQEKKCPAFTYTAGSSCVYSSNAFVGSAAYTIVLKTPTPTPNLSATTTTIVKSATPTPGQTVSDTVPTPTVTSTSTSHVFHKGFNAFGSNIAIDPDRLVDLGLYVYRFGGDWIIYPGARKFQMDAFKGYYIYAKADTPVDLSGGMYLTTSYRVGSGWNMLYTNQPRNLQTLLLNINNIVKPAKDWIALGVIKENGIYTIVDDRASEACNYFSILADADSAGDCSNNTVPRATQIPSGRTFWVNVSEN